MFVIVCSSNNVFVFDIRCSYLVIIIIIYHVPVAGEMQLI